MSSTAPRSQPTHGNGPYTIDRFENGEWAVLEDPHARTFNIPRAWLPSAAREGDVVRCVPRDDSAGSSSVSFELDTASRAEQLSRARQLRDRLPRGPKGDVSL